MADAISSNDFECYSLPSASSVAEKQAALLPYPRTSVCSTRDVQIASSSRHGLAQRWPAIVSPRDGAWRYDYLVSRNVSQVVMEVVDIIAIRMCRPLRAGAAGNAHLHCSVAGRVQALVKHAGLEKGLQQTTKAAWDMLVGAPACNLWCRWRRSRTRPDLYRLMSLAEHALQSEGSRQQVRQGSQDVVAASCTERGLITHSSNDVPAAGSATARGLSVPGSDRQTESTQHFRARNARVANRQLQKSQCSLCTGSRLYRPRAWCARARAPERVGLTLSVTAE